MLTIKIELRCDDSDPEKVKLITEAGRMAAKHFYTTALLLADKRKPQIAMQVGDLFETDKEINLADDIQT